jgi:hypothetical protein
MDAATPTIPTPAAGSYTSRPGALVWFFKKSRDQWKEKYRALKATGKGLQNQIAAVTKSRARWRTEAEQAGRRVADLEAELSALRSRIARAEEKKRIRAAVRCTSLPRSGASRVVSSTPWGWCSGS